MPDVRLGLGFDVHPAELGRPLRLGGVEIPDAPRGPVKLDARGSPIQNIYVRKVEKKDGELWNTVIHTFPAVSQFWKYKPEEFLKQPVYNRNYPACKYC